MQIAVLGGGNGSFAAAGDLARGGHSVRLWRRDQAAVIAQQAAGKTVLLKDFKAEVQLTAVTNDIAAAVQGADLIFVRLPQQHRSISPACLRRISPTTRLSSIPPGTFGSVLFAKVAREAGNRARVAYAETGTLPGLRANMGLLKSQLQCAPNAYRPEFFRLDSRRMLWRCCAAPFPASSRIAAMLCPPL